MAGRSALIGIVALGCLFFAGDAAATTQVQFREIGMATGVDAVWQAPYLQLDDFPSFIEMNSGADYVLVQELYEEGSSQPKAELPAGVAYTSVVTLTLNSLPENPDPEADPFEEVLLLVMGVSNDQTATPPHPIYTTDQIEIVTDDPGHTPFDRTVYDPRGEGALYYYLGFVLSEGETVTFRYDVSEQAVGGTPVFLTNATYDYRLVPEPGTALLMGLGLVGLALCGRATDRGALARSIDGAGTRRA